MGSLTLAVQFIFLMDLVLQISVFTLLLFISFCAFYVWQIVLFVLSIMRLVDIYHFYTYLLQIPDVRPHPYGTAHFPNIFQEDIQTPFLVQRIGAIRNFNLLTELSSPPPHPLAG